MWVGIFTCALLLGLASCAVTYHQFEPVAIYESVGLADNGDFALAGLGYNGGPNRQMEIIDFAGTKLNSWNFTGTDFLVAGSAGNTYVAGISFNDSSQSADLVVLKTSVAGQKPVVLWTQSYANSWSPANHALHFSMGPTGNDALFVFFGQMNGKNGTAQIHSYDVLTGKLLWQAEQSAQMVLDFQVSVAGDVVSALVDSSLYIYYPSKPSLSASFALGFSNAVLCMSSHGRHIGVGFELFYSYQFEQWSNKWSEEWSTNGGADGFFVSSCAMSGSGYHVGVGWASFNYDQNRFQLYRDSSPMPVWTHLNTQSGAGHSQDIVAAMSFSMDDMFVGAASWGDNLGTNPQVMVWETSNPVPVFTLSTPGSMVDIDILEVSANKTAAGVVAGKHVHNNVFGDGGDLYFFQLQAQ